MHSLIKLLLISLFTISLYSETKYESKFGFLSEGTLLTSFKDARVALKVWLEDVALNYDGKVSVDFYDTSEGLYKDLKNKKLDMIVLDLPFFFKNKKDILGTADNFWSLNMDDIKYAQYYLIGKKSLNATSFKDIKNKTISFKEGAIGSFVWLDKNSLIYNKKPLKNVAKRIIFKKRESTAALNVFFNKSDFAIIRKKTWDIMTELNPSINKKVIIIEKSKEIHVPFIGMFNKNVEDSSSEYFFKLTNDLSKLSGNNNITNLLKFNSVFKVNNEKLKYLDVYYDEYFKLQKKYK